MARQRHLRVACGRSTSNSPTSTRTNPLALALLIAFSTPTSTNCKSTPKRRHTVRVVYRAGRTKMEFAARSGSVCLDVINQTWSPMFDMINIFEVFLPQLLRYPNPTAPLNGEAAALLMREPKSYDAKVKGTASPFPTPAKLSNMLSVLILDYRVCSEVREQGCCRRGGSRERRR